MKARGLALALGLVLAVAVFELGGRWVIARILGASVELDVDHRMRPNALLGINEDGIRSSLRSEAFGDDSYNVVFLGDSFTFGLGVEAGQSFPEVFGRRWAGPPDGRPVRVANFGWTSSSPLLSLRLLRDIGAKYSPDLVVLALDLSDFQDDIRYAKQLDERDGVTLSPTSFLLRSWGLDRLGASDDPDSIPRDRLFLANQPLDAVRPHLAATDRNIADIAAYARNALGAEFVLVGLPRGFMYDRREHPNWHGRRYTPLGSHSLGMFEWLSELSLRVDHPVVPLLEDFRNAGVFPTCFGNDPHYNVQGHRIAARAIARRLDDVLFQTRSLDSLNLEDRSTP